MIKYNSNTINNWYYGDDNIVKVYRNGAVCYYKIISSGGTTAQTPCYAVVNDISQYEDTEFEDVFNDGDGKWYKLNNLNQYEEYGLYGSGRTITYYEGKLTIDGSYEYMYSGGSWNNVGEVSGSTATLPNVDYMLNYNARDYVASTYTIPKTSGQIKDVDAVCNYGYNIVDHHEDGYITVTGNTRMILSGSTYLGRNNNQTGCTMTIVSKAKTTTNYSIITNRGNNQTRQMNWMWRYPSNGIFLHGGSSYNSVKYYTNTTVNPIIASIRTSYNNGVVQQLNDWTNNGSYNGSFAFGTEYNGNSSLFCDYASNNDEFWRGDFYWVYMSKTVLTDEQIQQVIAYNEGGGGTAIYPLYYDEKLDPPNNVSFTSMTEAEEYECPWVGMQATIDGVRYIFSGDSTSGYEWVEKPTPSYKYWMWRSTSGLSVEGTIQFSEFDLVADGADVNLTYISGIPSGFTGQGPENLFDNNIYTKYCANLLSYKATNYVLFEAPNAISPTIFSMTTANDSASYRRHPDEWVLLGSNTSTTNWNDGSWDLVLSGTCGSEMSVNYTRFDFPITYN